MKQDPTSLCHICQKPGYDCVFMGGLAHRSCVITLGRSARTDMKTSIVASVIAAKRKKR